MGTPSKLKLQGCFDFNPIVGDANAENLSYSKYGDMHRIIGVASQSWSYGSNNRWDLPSRLSLNTIVEK